MSRQAIRVLYPNEFPAVSANCSQFPPRRAGKFCQLPGLMVEIIDLIARSANLTIIPYTTTQLGHDAEDYMVPLSQFLLEDAVDVIAKPYQKTDYGLKHFEYSRQIYSVQMRILRKVEDMRYDRAWSFFQTYDKHTWMAFVFVWMLQLLFCALVRRAEANANQTEPVGFLESAWHMLRIQLMQPEQITFSFTSGNISIIFFSLFQCSIFLGVFSSWILASMIYSKPTMSDVTEDIINSLQSGRKFMVRTDPHHWIYEEINNTAMSPLWDIRQSFLHNPVRDEPNIDRALQMVVEGEAFMFQQEDDESHFKAMMYCDVARIEHLTPAVGARLLLQKNSSFHKEVNRAIDLQLKTFNRLSKKYFEYAHQLNRCSAKSTKQPLNVRIRHHHADPLPLSPKSNDRPMFASQRSAEIQSFRSANSPSFQWISAEAKSDPISTGTRLYSIIILLLFVGFIGFVELRPQMWPFKTGNLTAEESAAIQAAKICWMGWGLLALWLIVITYIIRDYWRHPDKHHDELKGHMDI